MGVILSTKSLFNVFPEMSRLSGMVERIKEFDQTRYPPIQINTADFVQLSKVGFKFDEKTIFENIDFTTSDSKKILIVGPNGSGKSTLSHIISGLFTPSSGNVTTFPLSRISAVIYPFEFIPGSISDNFSFANSEIEDERFKRLCQKFNFDSYLDRDPAELSAGERKKLEIMIGLVKESDIYIFDEPLSGIDVSKKDDIMDEIFNNTEGKTLIVIMHGDEKYHSFFDKKLEFGKSSDTD
jgi:ABC-type multidrug transport system ATPase subunit